MKSLLKSDVLISITHKRSIYWPQLNYKFLELCPCISEQIWCTWNSNLGNFIYVKRNTTIATKMHNDVNLCFWTIPAYLNSPFICAYEFYHSLCKQYKIIWTHESMILFIYLFIFFKKCDFVNFFMYLSLFQSHCSWQWKQKLYFLIIFNLHEISILRIVCTLNLIIFRYFKIKRFHQHWFY